MLLDQETAAEGWRVRCGGCAVGHDQRHRRSVDAKRECARSADLAGGPDDGRRVVKGELRDPLEPGFEGDPKLHARQVRTHAAVDAEAERGVTVDLAVNNDL